MINRENLRDPLGRVGSDDQPTKVVLSAADLASELTALAQWLARWSASPTPGSQSHDAG